jgi:hypothetical protein
MHHTSADCNFRNSASQTLIVSALALGALAAMQSPALAISARVKLACASDYYAYCSQHAVGSPGVRQCMRDNGKHLSTRCINALVAAGEVSEDEVARRAASLR